MTRTKIAVAPSEAYAAYPFPVAPILRSRHRRQHR
jgi:hypothetical protein